MKKGAVKQRGFTIIEVVLVLGVAGLIFMMVFIALPTLQRNARDAQRRDDMLIFADALKKYQTNNRGALPVLSIGTDVVDDIKGGNVRNGGYDNAKYTTTWAGFYRDYLDVAMMDPSGGYYNMYVTECNKNTNGGCSDKEEWLDAFGGIPYILVVTGASCSGEEIMQSSNPRKVVIMYKLEGGGFYCGNN